MAATATIHFSVPAFIEIVHEIQAALRFEDEFYQSDFDPKTSGLTGLFTFQASGEFGKFPPGIISGTDRKVGLSEMVLKIQGETRRVGPSAEPFRPVLLGQSTLFPDKEPLQIKNIEIHFQKQSSQGLEFLPPLDENFETLLSYKGDTEKLFLRGLFKAWIKKSVTDSVEPQGFHPFNDWKTIQGFNTQENLIQVVLIPNPPSIGEGETGKIEIKILPIENLGEGELSAEMNTLNLLNGYKGADLEKLSLKTSLEGKENSSHEGTGFEFHFKPLLGTGTYDIQATSTLSLVEEDTETTVENSIGGGVAQFEVTDGFKITHPSKNAIFPPGAEIVIRTSFDEDIESWKAIKWYKNGEEWEFNDQSPPHNLIVDSIDTTLEAVYKKNPTSPEMRDSVVIKVKDIQFFITPSLLATINSNVFFSVRYLDKGQEFPIMDIIPWSGNIVASVTAISWSKHLDEIANVDFKKTKLSEMTATFKKRGALTTLASLTINLLDKTQDPPKIVSSFKIKSKRADIWSFEPPKWGSLKGHLPKKAIAQSGRTYKVDNGSVIFLGRKYDWSASTHLSEEIKLKVALPITQKDRNDSDKFFTRFKQPWVMRLKEEYKAQRKLLLDWQGPSGVVSDNKDKFVPFFSRPGNQEVIFQADLYFKELDETRIPLIQDEKNSFRVEVFPLESTEGEKGLVKFEVIPNDFVINPGEDRELRFLIKREKDGFTDLESMLLLDGAFKLSCENITWYSSSGNFIQEANPFLFNLSMIENPPLPKGTDHLIAKPLSPTLKEVSIENNVEEKPQIETKTEFSKANQIKLIEISFLSGSEATEITSDFNNEEGHNSDIVKGNRNLLFDRAKSKYLEPPQWEWSNSKGITTNSPLSYARNGSFNLKKQESKLLLSFKLKNFSPKPSGEIKLKVSGTYTNGVKKKTITFPDSDIPPIESLGLYDSNQSNKNIISIGFLPESVGTWTLSLTWEYLKEGLSLGQDVTSHEFFTTFGKSRDDMRWIRGVYSVFTHIGADRPSRYLELVKLSCAWASQLDGEKNIRQTLLIEAFKNHKKENRIYCLDPAYYIELLERAIRGIDTLLDQKMGACGDHEEFYHALVEIQGLDVSGRAFWASFPHLSPSGEMPIGNFQTFPVFNNSSVFIYDFRSHKKVFVKDARSVRANNHVLTIFSDKLHTDSTFLTIKDKKTKYYFDLSAEQIEASIIEDYVTNKQDGTMQEYIKNTADIYWDPGDDIWE